MIELSNDQLDKVSAGITSSEQIGIQMGIVGVGVALAAAGLALTPLGAGYL